MWTDRPKLITKRSQARRSTDRRATVVHPWVDDELDGACDERYKITKRTGLTPTECLCGNRCEKAFRKLWSWSNPRRAQGKEICDNLVISPADG